VDGSGSAVGSDKAGADDGDFSFEEGVVEFGVEEVFAFDLAKIAAGGESRFFSELFE